MSNPLDRVLADSNASVTAPALRKQEVVGGAGSTVSSSSQTQRGVQEPGANVNILLHMQAGGIDGSRQEVHVHPALEPRYFEIVVRLADEGPGGGAPTAELEPGTAYRVHLRAAYNPVTPPDPTYVQHPVRVRSTLRLFTEAALPDAGVPAEVDPEIAEYAAQTPADWAAERVLRLPAEYGNASLRLRLLYQEPGGPESSLATERQFTVLPGAAVPPARPVAHAVDARFAPPPRTAVLYLSSTGPGQVLASGFVPEQPDRPQLRSFELPPPPGGPFRDAADYVRELADWTTDFATGGTGGIGPWLDEVLQQYGDDCSLMITDDSGAATPWEMFPLKSGGRLGARARVVRWVNMVYRDEPLTWQTNPVRVPYRLAAYVHPGAAGSALAQTVGDCADDDELSDLLLAAAEQGAPVGLVYLAGAAGLANDDQELAALRALQPAPAETMRFRLRGLEGKLSPRPLVFANTPYSGRVPRAGARPAGLACALLAQVASGYIGVLGPLDAELAGAVGAKVLDAAADREVRPAELLRQLRAHAQQTADNRELARDRRAAALFPFLYVYYGNPHLSLSPGPENTDA